MYVLQWNLECLWLCLISLETYCFLQGGATMPGPASDLNNWVFQVSCSFFLKFDRAPDWWTSSLLSFTGCCHDLCCCSRRRYTAGRSQSLFRISSIISPCLGLFSWNTVGCENRHERKAGGLVLSLHTSQLSVKSWLLFACLRKLA